MTFAKSAISEFKEQEDQDFTVAEKEDHAAISHVVDSLVYIANEAKKQNAAVLVPDYTTVSPGSLLIQNALNFVDFPGPVINICLEEQVAWDAATALKKYQFFSQQHPRGILLDRATVSVQVAGSKASSVSLVAARLISALSRPDGVVAAAAQGVSAADGGPPTVYAIAVFAGGGQAVLRHVAEAARAGAHVVVLQGSGRLCDYLPRVWFRRFSADFDAFEEGRRFCSACGFPAADGAEDGRLLRDIVLHGHVKIHALAGGTGALQRVLGSVWELDEALVLAVKRHCEYQTSATRMDRPETALLLSKAPPPPSRPPHPAHIPRPRAAHRAYLPDRPPPSPSKRPLASAFGRALGPCQPADARAAAPHSFRGDGGDDAGGPGVLHHAGRHDRGLRQRGGRRRRRERPG